MKKGKESVIRKEENFEVVRYNYYFKSKEEMNQFVLNNNEKLIGQIFFNPNGLYACSMQVEIVRSIETKHIYDADEYAPFIKNLQKTQYSFGYSSEWYNNWIDYVNKMPYDEACTFLNF